MGFRKVAFTAGLAPVLVVAALVTAIGRASPSSFTLVMENGFHTAAGPPDKFPLGFRHEGPFAASSPVCPSGYAVDLAVQPPMELRYFTCSDGSGSITARKVILRADAQFTHEEGAWAIVAGTGRYSTLRGKGTAVLDTVTGNPADHITTRFNETWIGVVDFDVTRPVVRISQASAKRLQRPMGIYSVRVVFSARDGSDANAVSYDLTMSGGPSVFAHRSGTTTSGTVSITFRIRPHKDVRRLRLTVVASDPVGNETKVIRQVRLPA
jgi:hypothetical protein